MRIIPAIDLIEGKCVRLSMGDYSTKKIYNQDPIEEAKKIDNEGIKYLHLVDLDGAISSHIVNLKILEKIVLTTNLKIDFGGGIKSNSDIKSVFNAGARQVTIGSIAVNNSNLFLEWLNFYGSEKIILGADCYNRKIVMNGWLNTSIYDVGDYIKNYVNQGVSYVMCTDILKDGMLKGPSVKLYTEILRQNSVKLIASGGISSIKDLEKVKKTGCEGVIIGRALYEKQISLKDLIKFSQNLS